PGHRPTVTLEDMRHLRTNPEFRVIDSRAAERYRGEVEPIDPVAGHIPGAISAPFIENLDASGHFLPPEKLAARFQALTGETPPDHTIFYCGSGVTACHNLLAYEHAGLGIPVLYPGSWSEWITRPENPVETGNGGHIAP
ncbi:MAG: sulfurtransferase, partial [Bacteroidetes bacterium]